jgi:hypothetical protein
VTGAQRVGAKGAVGIGLTTVDVGPRGRVHHGVGAQLGGGREHRVAIGDVELPVRGRHDVVALERPDQVVAELAAGPGDQDAHAVRPP